MSDRIKLIFNIYLLLFFSSLLFVLLFPFENFSSESKGGELWIIKVVTFVNFLTYIFAIGPILLRKKDFLNSRSLSIKICVLFLLFLSINGALRLVMGFNFGIVFFTGAMMMVSLIVFRMYLYLKSDGKVLVGRSEDDL